MTNPMQPKRAPMPVMAKSMVALGGQHPATVGVKPVHAGGANPFGSARKGAAPISSIGHTPTFNPATGWNHPATPAPAPSTPITPVPGTPPPLDPNATHDAQWQANTNASNFDYQNQRDGLKQQLGGLDAKFAQADGDRKQWYNNDTYGSDANLAQRGIFNSGSRDQAFADRSEANAKQSAQIDQNYGATAKNAITQALANLDQQQQLSTDSENAAAGDRYAAAHPYVPAPDPVPSNPIAAAVRAPITPVKPKPKAVVKPTGFIGSKGAVPINTKPITPKVRR